LHCAQDQVRVPEGKALEFLPILKISWVGPVKTFHLTLANKTITICMYYTEDFCKQIIIGHPGPKFVSTMVLQRLLRQKKGYPPAKNSPPTTLSQYHGKQHSLMITRNHQSRYSIDLMVWEVPLGY